MKKLQKAPKQDKTVRQQPAKPQSISWSRERAAELRKPSDFTSGGNCACK
jgi:hypothetical protein